MQQESSSIQISANNWIQNEQHQFVILSLEKISSNKEPVHRQNTPQFSLCHRNQIIQDQLNQQTWTNSQINSAF